MPRWNAQPNDSRSRSLSLAFASGRDLRNSVGKFFDLPPLGMNCHAHTRAITLHRESPPALIPPSPSLARAWLWPVESPEMRAAGERKGDRLTTRFLPFPQQTPGGSWANRITADFHRGVELLDLRSTSSTRADCQREREEESHR